jgi:BlaI family transcriptional regulator, penicillinase repressor
LELQTFNGKEAVVMPRPVVKELTQRELEVMHLFWTHGPLTAAAARDHLADAGRDLTYTTVATLVRLLFEKGFLQALNDERPFVYAPVRSHEDVSKRLLSNVLDCVFKGSREQLLLRLFEERQLTKEERVLLQSILEEEPA